MTNKAAFIMDWPERCFDCELHRRVETDIGILRGGPAVHYVCHITGTICATREDVERNRGLIWGDTRNEDCPLVGIEIEKEGGENA
jgi:hypothetical protein